MSQQIASPVATALAEAANAAGYAPSIHNTQPWSWRVGPERLELFAVRDRQLAATDPDARLMTLSCGAALHHARLALLAHGWSARVRHLPDPARPDLLADLVADEPVEMTPDAVRMVWAMRVRHTDRRPVSDEPVPPAVEATLTAAADGLARLHWLTADQVVELAAAACRAGEIAAEDPLVRAELAYWTSRSAPAGTGLPPDVLPARPPETTVPARDYGSPGTLPIGPGHDRQARYAVLYGDDDEPTAWLRAGEALAAVWLTAVGEGVSVVPLSGAVEVPATRGILRGLLSGIGFPYLVLRLGIMGAGGPPATPRLPAERTVDVDRT
ncbi:Acg family FMN-binding oxidoreductase [Asanoa siamensis]|nr:nitroreductase [Asanoa siamensis]